MTESTVQRYIRQHDLVHSGDVVVVGVSGGADSMALSHILHRLAPKMKVKLVIAHLNHGIRGQEADADEAFVRAWAQKLGVHFISAHRDVPRLAKERSVSIEMAAREARHAFFQSCKGDAIALAHTSDDQAETLLMRFIRGSGPRGLAGMSPVSIMQGMKIVRPLLDVSRSEVIAYLQQHRITWREDASNLDPVYQRNRVRHELLPLLEKEYNPSIRATLQRTANLFRDEDRLLQTMAEATAIIDKHNQLQTAPLNGHPVAVQRRILMGWLERGGFPPDRVDFDLIDRVVRLATGAKGTKSLSLASGWTVVRRYRVMQLLRERKTLRPYRRAIKRSGVTMVRTAGLRISATRSKGILTARPGRPGDLPASASISAKKMGRAGIVVRSWRVGDRMKPHGMRGSKKLQDIFVDAKIPRDERDAIPVFECRGEIIWIPGYRIARDWALKDDNEQALHLHVSGLE